MSCKMRLQLSHRLSTALIGAVLTACSAQPHKSEPITAPEDSKPLVYVVAGDSPPGFGPAAEAATREALAGTRLTFDAADANQAPVRIELSLQYRNLTESEFEGAWRQAALVLLTAYPTTCRHRVYDLNATISRNDGLTRGYHESDSTVAWVWLLQGPHCDASPTQEEVTAETRSMVAAIFRHIQSDGALNAAARGIIPTQTPRVHIDVNRARDIVEQVAHIERPFERWSLSDDGEGAPDYVVALQFDLQPGRYSLPRAFLAMGTLGASTLLSGLCTASQVSLAASISGTTSARTRSYSFSDSVTTRTQGPSSRCETVDETTHPEVFATLLRRLFDRIRQDELIQAHAQNDRPRHF